MNLRLNPRCVAGMPRVLLNPCDAAREGFKPAATVCKVEGGYWIRKLDRIVYGDLTKIV